MGFEQSQCSSIGIEGICEMGRLPRHLILGGTIASGICAVGKEEVLMNEWWNGAAIVCGVGIWHGSRDLAISGMGVEDGKKNEWCQETCSTDKDEEPLHPGRHVSDKLQATNAGKTTGSRENISADAGRMVAEGIRPRLRQKQAFWVDPGRMMMSTVAFLTNYQRGPLAREFSREIKRGIPIEGVQPRISAQSQNGRVIIGGGRKLLNLSLLGKLQATQATPPGPMLALALISEALDATK